MSQDEPAVNDEVVAESTAPESAPVETKTEVADPLLDVLSSDDDEVVDTKTETKEEPEASEQAPEAPEETQETETEEQPRGKAEERKDQLNQEIRGLVEQRKALREEVEQLNASVYAPQTAAELVEQGYSETDARVAALEQRAELAEFNNRVVETNLALSEESQRVLSDFEIFNPDSENFQEDLAASAAEVLEANLIKDPNTGQIIGYHTSPYKIYKPIADAYEKSKIQGQIKGQKATEQMLASVDAPTSSTPRESKKDPLLEILSSDD